MSVVGSDEYTAEVELMNKIIIKENFEEVDNLENNKQFIFNKSIFDCNQNIKCKPNFRFVDKIIDTKLGGIK